MIVYESNKNWLRDVGHLYRSWTMQKVVRATLLVGLFATAFCIVDIEVLNIKEHRFDASIFSLLGIVLSILLAFRTNTAYDRWWEGRKQWGSLVNNCRSLAILIHASFPEKDRESRKYLAVRISNFCIAMKEHLRKGVQLEELVQLAPKEQATYREKGHIPNYIAYEIQQRIQDVYKSEGITLADHMNLKVHTGELLNILGSCERIKKTPIPFSYNVYIKIFISLYTLLLPMALIPLFGYYAIPIVMFVFFAFIGLELMAEEIEEPFGLDCNDLPTGDIAQNIMRNVFEILEAPCPEKNETEQKLYEKVF